MAISPNDLRSIRLRRRQRGGSPRRSDHGHRRVFSSRGLCALDGAVALRNESYKTLRRRLGQAILLGLEVLIVGDIVRTIIVDTTLKSVGVLGMIVIIRIVLSFSLEVEIDGTWPWNLWRLKSAEWQDVLPKFLVGPQPHRLLGTCGFFRPAALVPTGVPNSQLQGSCSAERAGPRWTVAVVEMPPGLSTERSPLA